MDIMRFIILTFLLQLSFTANAAHKNISKVYMDSTQVLRLQILASHVIRDFNLNDNTKNEMIETVFNLIINNVNAMSRKLCFDRGGWPSFKDGKRCASSYRVSNNKTLKKLGPTYNKEMFCGEKKFFRCNPVIFGRGDEGRDTNGFCVQQKTNFDYTLSCLEATKNNMPKSIESILGTEETRKLFLGQIKALLNVCEKNNWSLKSCAKLRDFVIENIQVISKCFGEEEVSDLLPHIELPVRFDEWLKIKSNINIKDIAKSIDKYSNSNETKAMIKRLQKNYRLTCEYATRCKKVKSNRPTGMCFRYVKHGMMAGDFTDEYNKSHNMSYPYTNSPSAKKAGTNLLEQSEVGFSNLLNIDGFEDLTPYTAPKGSILVYSGGKHGHIEVKTDNAEFISDYMGEKPIYDEIPSLSGKRKLIGVYVKLDQENL